MFKIYPYRLVHTYLTYKILDIKNLFNDYQLHPQTIRKWIKDKKLEAFEYEGEFYVYGGVLKLFLKERNEGNKKKLEFNEFKCWKCKKIDKPINNEIIKQEKGKGGCLLLFAICKHCKQEMQKPFKKENESKIKEYFNFKIEKQTTLCISSTSTNKTNIKSISKTIQSELSKNKEQKQLTLFDFNYEK